MKPLRKIPGFHRRKHQPNDLLDSYVLGSFKATGALSKEKPSFTLSAYMTNAAGARVWEGERKISAVNRKSSSPLSSVELNLGMIPIRKAGSYTRHCDTADNAYRKGGVGTGTMELDIILLRQAKTFPLKPVIGGVVVLMVAIFGFGKPSR